MPVIAVTLEMAFWSLLKWMLFEAFLFAKISSISLYIKFTLYCIKKCWYWKDEKTTHAKKTIWWVKIKNLPFPPIIFKYIGQNIANAVEDFLDSILHILISSNFDPQIVLGSLGLKAIHRNIFCNKYLTKQKMIFFYLIYNKRNN